MAEVATIFCTPVTRGFRTALTAAARATTAPRPQTLTPADGGVRREAYASESPVCAGYACTSALLSLGMA